MFILLPFIDSENGIKCFNSSLCMHESVGMSTLTQLELGDKISLSFFFFCRSSSRNDKHSVQNNHQKQGT